MILKLIDICLGRRICAWCGKDMGFWPFPGDTHGICKDCKRNLGY